MRDPLFFTLLALIAVGMVALALVWPQGSGAPSPPPFGHPLAPITLPTTPLPHPTPAPSTATVRP